MTDRVFVAAISGMSGAGKSSLVKKTLEFLGDAVALHFDDYISVSTYPPDLPDWLRRGADVTEWKTPRLADDLRRLRAGQAITLPDDRGVLQPARYIVMEEPFGRLRPEMYDLIDLTVHLDVPADVLLARRLLRRLDEERHQGEKLLEVFARDLERHLASGRELEALGSMAARNAADLVLDGTKSVQELAEQVVARIHSMSN